MIDPNPKLTEQQALNDVAFKTLIEAIPATMPLTDNANSDAFLMLHSQSDGGIGHYVTAGGAGTTYAIIAAMVNASQRDAQIYQAVLSAAGYLLAGLKSDQPIPVADLKIKLAAELPDVYYMCGADCKAVRGDIAPPAPPVVEDIEIDLLEDLPATGILENTADWTRSLDEQNVKAEQYTNHFNALLGTKTKGKDLYLWFQMALPTKVTVERVLPIQEASEWAIEGLISYGDQFNGDLKDFTETGEGGQLLQVKDINDKIIAELAPRQFYVGRKARLVGNNKDIVEGELFGMRTILGKLTPFSILGVAGTVVFGHGDTHIVTPLFDSDAIWKQPTKLTITMWQGKAGANKRELVLSELKFRSKR